MYIWIKYHVYMNKIRALDSDMSYVCMYVCIRNIHRIKYGHVIPIWHMYVWMYVCMHVLETFTKYIACIGLWYVICMYVWMCVCMHVLETFTKYNACIGLWYVICATNSVAGLLLVQLCTSNVSLRAGLWFSSRSTHRIYKHVFATWNE